MTAGTDNTRKDIPAVQHPHYKQVYLRMIPIDGGKPKVIAYVYGGQGTINVPSWSPDGRHVAFVSQTDKLSARSVANVCLHVP